MTAAGGTCDVCLMPARSHRAQGFAGCLSALGDAIVSIQQSMEAAGRDLLGRGLTEAGVSLLSGVSCLPDPLARLANADPAAHRPLRLVPNSPKRASVPKVPRTQGTTHEGIGNCCSSSTVRP